MPPLEEQSARAVPPLEPYQPHIAVVAKLLPQATQAREKQRGWVDQSPEVRHLLLVRSQLQSESPRYLHKPEMQVPAMPPTA